MKNTGGARIDAKSVKFGYGECDLFELNRGEAWQGRGEHEPNGMEAGLTVLRRAVA